MYNTELRVKQKRNTTVKNNLDVFCLSKAINTNVKHMLDCVVGLQMMTRPVLHKSWRVKELEPKSCTITNAIYH